MSKIEWVDSKKGIAITLTSLKDIVGDIYEQPWPGAKPELGEVNHYANGRASMRDDMLEKINEMEEKINGLSNDRNR